MSRSTLHSAPTIPPPPEMRLAARRTSAAARSLALGFGAAVAMWAVAYLAMMAPGVYIGEALFALTLGVVFTAGFIAGRWRVPREAGWAAGAKAAFVAATVNLLLIGSLVGGKSGRELIVHFALWTAGNYGATLVLGALGGAIAQRRDGGGESNRPWRDWFSLFTSVAAATVFLLLITGGLVTGLEAGLAVPDWPNSFGHNMLLYPLSNMIGGIYYEHAHRLYGMLVGVTAITLGISAFFFDSRKWLRAIAVAYLLLVIGQGVLGGAGRVLQREVWYAIVHGVFGQIVFATVCAIAVFTSPAWMSSRPPPQQPSAKTDRTWTTLLVAALLLQLVLGALYRHTLHTHLLYTHIVWAAFVAGLAVFAGGRAWGRREEPILVRSGKAVLHTVGLQIALGVVAMIAVLSRDPTPTAQASTSPAIDHIPLWETVFTTAHQATGALLLGLATMLMFWTRRLCKAQA